MKFPRLGRLAKLIPQVEVSTQRREEFGKPPMRFFLSGRAFGVLDHFVDCSREFIYAGTRDDNRIATTVRFLGDPEEFPTIVFAEFHVEMLAFDLQVPGLDEIIHVCKKPRSLGRSAAKREAVFLSKKRVCNGFVENRFYGGLTPSRTLFRALLSDGEVDLAFKGVDSRDEHANLAPD
jgi:hypothetical protein